MSGKRVNMHMEGELHAALKEIAEKRALRAYDVIEGMVDNLPTMTQEIIDHTRAIPEMPKRSTVKVTTESRDKIRERADSYNLTMAKYLRYAIANFYNIESLKARYDVSLSPEEAAAKPVEKKEPVKENLADSNSVLFSETPHPRKKVGNMNTGGINYKESDEVIEHYAEAGRRSLDLSNMTADDVRRILAEGGQKASLLKQRMKAIKKDQEKAEKEREKRMAKRDSGSKSADSIVAEFKRAAAEHRKENGLTEPVKKQETKTVVPVSQAKVEVREILVQDVSFDVECRQLSEIIDKLDKSIDKLTELKRYGSNYESINNAINGNNAAVFSVNRYITQRRRIHNRMEAERDAAEEAARKENVA